MNQKTVFITGATGDIGEAITLKFAQFFFIHFITN